MPMYNLLENSDNYSLICGSLQNYYKDDVNDVANDDNDAYNYRINSNKTITTNFF